jgi:glycosyltransferase involved in cell wall biosynthesis
MSYPELLCTQKKEDELNLGYLVSQYPARSHTFIRREIEALRRNGVRVRIFSIRRPTEEFESARDRAAVDETCYLLPTNIVTLLLAHATALFTRPLAYLRTLSLALRHRVSGLRALVWAIFHFAEAILLAQELDRLRLRHLHNHFANSAANVGLLASHFLQLPWSLTLHGIADTNYPAGPLLGAKIETARFVACASYFGRAQAMRASSPEHWHKITVVRCGLDLKNLPQGASPHADQCLRVICVGRLAAEKGHLGLLEAFALLCARQVEVFLTIVGGGPEWGRIRERIGVLGLQNRVSLLGPLSEEETLLQIACSDLLVLASLMEGLPVVLMEAMALGLPVVAPRLAGIPELVADEQQGLLFCPADWADLEQKMARLLTDPNLRSRLGRAGRAKIEAEFDVDRTVRPLIELFHKNQEESGGAIVHRCPPLRKCC